MAKVENEIVVLSCMVFGLIKTVECILQRVDVLSLSEYAAFLVFLSESEDSWRAILEKNGYAEM